MCGRVVFSLAIALLVSSAAYAGGLDQPQSDLIGSCQNAQFDRGHTSWDCGQSMMDRGHHCGGCGQCGWGYHHQSIAMVQCIRSVGHCGGIYLCQSINMSSGIGCGPQQHGGCDGPGAPHPGPGPHADQDTHGDRDRNQGITSQSCMILSTHSTHLGGIGMMMASQVQIVR